MAITIDGVPVSGSYGLITQSRNRYGAYRRRRTKPVNPTSSRQTSARAVFRNAVNRWTDLISIGALRSPWETYAAAIPWLNKAGETVRLTGQAMYIRCQSAAQAAGLALNFMDSPPPVFSLGSLDVTVTSAEIVSSDLVLTNGNVLLNNSWAATGGKLLIEISLPANVGRQFPGPKWQSVGVITGAAAATSTITVPLSSLSFPPAADQAVWFRFRGIAPTADRRVSTQQIAGPVLVG
jgi:hypothetical protein